MTTDIPPILVIGCDQCQAGPSGIVLIEYHVTGGGTPILGYTTKGLTEMRTALVKIFKGFKNIAVVAREEGFFSPKTPDAGLEVERSGGWVEAIAATLWPDAIRMRFLANKWRECIHGYSNGSTDHWKATQLTWAQGRDPNGVITDEHRADATGIGETGGEEWYKTHGVQK